MLSKNCIKGGLQSSDRWRLKFLILWEGLLIDHGGHQRFLEQCCLATCFHWQYQKRDNIQCKMCCDLYACNRCMGQLDDWRIDACVRGQRRFNIHLVARSASIIERVWTSTLSPVSFRCAEVSTLEFLKNNWISNCKVIADFTYLDPPSLRSVTHTDFIGLFKTDLNIRRKFVCRKAKKFENPSYCKI